MVEPAKFWNIARKWEGQPAFVIGGGTSVTMDMIESLRGRNVIAVNGSYHNAPWAPILFFADQRWWVRENQMHGDKLRAFKGLVATTSRQSIGKKLLRLKRVTPEEVLPERRDTVALRRTSLVSAMDICYHRGASKIILLGADNRDGSDGRVHHHEEYPWPRPKNTWDVKLDDLKKRAVAFERAGVPVFNCSPITTLSYWPTPPLEQVLKEIDR